MATVDHTQKIELATDSARKFLQMGSSQRLANLLSKFHAADIVSILSGLGNQERLSAWKALRVADLKLAAETLTEMPEETARTLLTDLGPLQVANILRVLPVDDAAHLAGLLPDELLSELREEDDAERTITPELAHHLFYPDETAGRIMTTNVFALPESITVGEATRALQERGDQFEMVFYLYVVDDAWCLVGVVSLRQLLLNPPATPIRRVMSSDVISVRVDADQEEVAQTIARYNLLAVPVVNVDKMLIGLITVDDAIDILREEATEDMFALAGVDVEERILGNPGKAIRLRLPWLCVNLATASVAVSVISHFEATITDVVALATLMPIASGLGGNAGTQTLAVVVRAFALGELDGVSRLKVILKEVLVGLGNGAGAGLLAAIVASLWFSNPVLGLVLGLALMTNMVVGSLAGTVVPITLKVLNLDPATASSVFVTACTDMTGFGIFLGLATLLIQYLK